jgi:hypothetical protein
MNPPPGARRPGRCKVNRSEQDAVLLAVGVQALISGRVGRPLDLRSETESPFIDSASETAWVSLGIANQPLPTSPGCRIRFSASAVTNSAELLAASSWSAVELVPATSRSQHHAYHAAEESVPGSMGLPIAAARPIFSRPASLCGGRCQTQPTASPRSGPAAARWPGASGAPALPDQPTLGDPRARPARIQLWSASQHDAGAACSARPYSPFFPRPGAVRQRPGDHVGGTAIQGTFQKPTTYGARNRRRGSRPRCRRSRTRLAVAATRDQRVVVNAKPLSTRAPWWQTVLSGSARPCCSSALLFLSCC